MRKRGMFFAVYLTVITLVMSGVVVGLYLHQQGNIAAAVVSPLPILQIRDNLSLFEMREQDLILNSLESASGSFGSDEFASSFYENFLSGLDSDMKNFLVEDLYWSGSSFEEGDFGGDTFFSNVVYRVSPSYNLNKMIFVRSEIGKKGMLSSGGRDSVRFDVGYVFNFEKTYEITKVGNKFLVKEAD